MSGDNKRPWWHPQEADASWVARIREDYPNTTAGMGDQDIRDEYARGARYAVTWDDAGDAYEQFEPLADAYLSERALADRLAEALESAIAVGPGASTDELAALADYRERREG